MNYYEILKVKQNASQETIKTSYKKLIKKYHPDIYKGDKNYAEKMTKELNIAYDTLSVPALRREYDISIAPPSPVNFDYEENSINIDDDNIYNNGTDNVYRYKETNNNSSSTTYSGSTSYRPKNYDNENYYKDFYRSTTTNTYKTTYKTDYNEDDEQKIYDDYIRNYNARHHIKTENGKKAPAAKNVHKNFTLFLPLIFIFIIYLIYCLIFMNNKTTLFNNNNNNNSDSVYDYDTSNSDYYQNPNYKTEYTPPSKKENYKDSSYTEKQKPINPKEEKLLEKYSKNSLTQAYYQILSDRDLHTVDYTYDDFIEELYEKLENN